MPPKRKSKEQLFLLDLISALSEQVGRAQTKLVESQGTQDEGFDFGVVQGYWQVLSSLVSRLKIHDIDLAEYNLEGYDPDIIWTEIRERLPPKTKK